MKRVVAVDDKLANVRQALQEQGYQVAGLDQGLTNASVVVVSGMDDNLLGDESTVTNAQVIEAAGLSAEAVLQQVEEALRFQQ